ncbi:Helicase conserved C-terminal domain containing protein [Oxytricha trifallax]|uniref:Helicase conserved C-terminal domain containing protein n=1 Tax=Oxytricha trifallax TaxID=1172189 RepID=A0A073I0V3_9SPIT|nr:Helicase conserved C-terminal domain containing protein [Oxytricha trifallax]
MTEIFVQKWDFIDQDDFIHYLQQISFELKQRNPIWVSKLDDISDLGKNLAFIQFEKGVRNRRDVIQDCLKADFTKLNQLLNIPNKTCDFNENEQKKLLSQFKKLNLLSISVNQFAKSVGQKAFTDSRQMLRLQQILGFKFLTLQRLCINYLLWEDTQYSFINFGVGNGKTLLCSTLAALKSKLLQKIVFVVGKNEHLVLRDEKKFESIITSLGLNVNVNQYENKIGVYYLSQKYLESVMELPEFLDIWKQAIVIIDEYDWILFEGNVKQIETQIKFYRTAESVTGFTGSQLTTKESNCLKIAFATEEIVFPKLSSIVGDKRVKLDQELITSSQLDYCKRVFEISAHYCKLTPVIIVAQQSYTMIESHFKKFAQVPFFPMKNVKGTKVEAQFDHQFFSKNNDDQFGVFLLNEQQGRGTDLKTTHEIQFNGGLFLIVADIFSLRSTEQILGRIGRLHRKGTYKQVIYKQGSKETADQVISLHQQFIENQNHIKTAALQTALGYHQWCKKADDLNQEHHFNKAVVDWMRSQSQIILTLYKVSSPQNRANKANLKCFISRIHQRQSLKIKMIMFQQELLQKSASTTGKSSSSLSKIKKRFRSREIGSIVMI